MTTYGRHGLQQARTRRTHNTCMKSDCALGNDEQDFVYKANTGNLATVYKLLPDCLYLLYLKRLVGCM